MSHGGPPLYRCAGCGCPVLDHAVDDEERRECTLCECSQYLGVAHRHHDTWLLNLGANFIAAGLAATLDRWSRYPCQHNDARCLACNAEFAVDAMREAVSLTCASSATSRLRS